MNNDVPPVFDEHATWIRRHESNGFIEHFDRILLDEQLRAKSRTPNQVFKTGIKNTRKAAKTPQKEDAPRAMSGALGREIVPGDPNTCPLITAFVRTVSTSPEDALTPLSPIWISKDPRSPPHRGRTRIFRKRITPAPLY